MKLTQQILILLILGAIVFANSLKNGFVFDDNMITDNPLFRSKSPIEFFSGGPFYKGNIESGSGYIYRPIALVFLRITLDLFGQNALVFHLLPIVLHLSSAILVLFLLRAFLPQLLAFFAALIFLVHPTNSEVVAYISPLSDILFVFFGLAALVVAVYAWQSKGIIMYFLLTSFLLLSFLSKETGILFILLTPALYFIFKVKNSALIIAPIITTTIYALLRFVVADLQSASRGITPMATSILNERLLSLPKIIFYYLKSFFLPFDLSSGQHWLVKSLDFVNFWLPLAIVIPTFVAIFWFWFKIKLQSSKLSNVATFFLLWFLLGLGAHAQVFPLEYSVAQRWFYFTKIGLIGFLAAVGLYLWHERPDLKRYQNILIVTFCLVILAFCWRTFTRNSDWKDNLTLASRDLRINKNSFELELVYGTEQLKLKDYQQAKEHLQISVELTPYWLNINNLATAHLGLGEKDQALALFRKSAYDYGYYKSYENLASIYLLDDQLEESKAILDDAIKLYPNDPKLWYILSLYFEKSGQTKEAEEAKQKYLHLKQTTQLD